MVTRMMTPSGTTVGIMSQVTTLITCHRLQVVPRRLRMVRRINRLVTMKMCRSVIGTWRRMGLGFRMIGVTMGTEIVIRMRIGMRMRPRVRFRNGGRDSGVPCIKLLDERLVSFTLLRKNRITLVISETIKTPIVAKTLYISSFSLSEQLTRKGRLSRIT